MLDEFGNELEQTESKLDSTMKKVAKVLHITSGKLYDLFEWKLGLGNNFELITIKFGLKMQNL